MILDIRLLNADRSARTTQLPFFANWRGSSEYFKHQVSVTKSEPNWYRVTQLQRENFVDSSRKGNSYCVAQIFMTILVASNYLTCVRCFKLNQSPCSHRIQHKVSYTTQNRGAYAGSQASFANIETMRILRMLISRNNCTRFLWKVKLR